MQRNDLQVLGLRGIRRQIGTERRLRLEIAGTGTGCNVGTDTQVVHTRHDVLRLIDRDWRRGLSVAVFPESGIFGWRGKSGALCAQRQVNVRRHVIDLGELRKTREIVNVKLVVGDGARRVLAVENCARANIYTRVIELKT